jgi:anthranilate/para-aminobenzoate synthase component II
MHGKSSFINHRNQGCFEGLPNPMQVGRYHSLTALNLPKSFQVLADCDGQIMAVFDPNRRALGFQFHPESLLTTFGSRLLSNSIQQLLGLSQQMLIS